MFFVVFFCGELNCSHKNNSTFLTIWHTGASSVLFPLTHRPIVLRVSLPAHIINYVMCETANFLNNNISYILNPSFYQLKQNKDKFNIFYLNVNKLISHKRRDQFDYLLSKFGLIFDAIVLVETAFSDITSAYKLTGYDDFHNIRSRMGGGVSIYVLSRHNAMEALNTTTNENQAIIVKVPHMSIKLGGIYRPPHSNKLLFSEWFDDILNSHNGTIFTGDFNLNIFDVDVRNGFYYDTILSNNFVCINNLASNMYTRHNNVLSTCLDHCIVDKLDNNYNFFIGDNKLSDHRHFIISLPTNTQTSTLSSAVTFEKINITNVKKEILLLLQDANLSLNFFINRVDDILQTNTKSISKIKQISYKKPWFKKYLIKIKNKRDKLYKLSRKYENNAFYRLNFLIKKKELSDAITSEKIYHYSNLVNEHLHNPKQLWRLFKEITSGIHGASATAKIILKTQATLFIEDDAVANHLNEYFVNIGDSLAKKLPTVQYTIPSIKPHNSINTFEKTSPDEIVNIISNLKTDSSAGLDKFPTRLLKDISNNIAPFLSNSINECFDLGKFPDKYKIARVITIFKSGDKFDPSNYRPISILSVFSKVFENAIKSRLINYMNLHSVINSNQFGFVKGSNTTTATLNLLKEIYDNLNSSKKTACIFIDVMKAFDSMDFDILLSKLQSIGIGGKVLELLADYLDNRSQCVFANGVLSDFQTIKTGSPQGSVLAPILFLIYVNDMFDLSLSGTLQLFADDAVCTYGSADYASLRAKMESDLQKLYTWFTKNKLSMHIGKTKFITFYQRNTIMSNIFDEINLNDNIISRVDSYKYLGIFLDSYLNFTTHVNYVKNKILPYIRILSRIKHYLPSDQLKKIYFAHIHSHINYLLPIYSAAHDTKLRELLILQKKAVKHVFKLKPDHPSATLFRANILPLKTLSKSETCILFFKIKNRLINFNDCFPTRSEISHITTRQHNLYNYDKTDKEYIKKSFFYSAPVMFNSLPEQVKTCRSIDTFKISIKTFLSEVDTV